ncbi:S66 peptidase family protein [Salininema proteolyticum]|uniref:LD-carboxypeptidase n=1 Tax=Salininema proteolyticum TaxID=1607685 RepID=A0ABV8U0Y5_9ACTN
MIEALYPAKLAPGDTIAIAALSNTSARRVDQARRAAAVLREMGFEPVLSELTESESEHGWRSAPAEAQAAELNGFLADPGVRAVLAFTGGTSTFGYLDRIDVDAVRADPKPILGFSDITAVHLALYSRTGLIGFHADMAVTGPGGTWADLDGRRRKEIQDLYTGLLTGAAPIELPPSRPWQAWREGKATGTLIGGLLRRLTAVQATPFALPLDAFDGAVLFWEEVGQSPTDIWNDLQVLRTAGVFDRIAGMAVGRVAHMPEENLPAGRVTLRDAVMDAVAGFGFPVLGDMEFGHQPPNLPMPIGVRAELDAGGGALTLLGPAVR